MTLNRCSAKGFANNDALLKGLLIISVFTITCIHRTWCLQSTLFVFCQPLFSERMVTPAYVTSYLSIGQVYSKDSIQQKIQPEYLRGRVIIRASFEYIPSL